jgi:hypothetical protein
MLVYAHAIVEYITHMQASLKCILIEIEIELEVTMSQESLFTLKHLTLSGGLDRALRAARALTAKLPGDTLSSETSTSSLRKVEEEILFE